MRGVDVDETEGYEPAKSGDGWNPHVIRHLKIWALFCAIFVPLCIYGLDWSMYLDPEDPTKNQVRFAVIKTTTCIIEFLGLTGFVIFVETITNGNLIGRALSTPRSAAYLAAAFVIAGALIVF